MYSLFFVILYLIVQGGGEVDLKLGLSAAEFVKAYSPFVADCTYDGTQAAETDES